MSRGLFCPRCGEDMEIEHDEIRDGRAVEHCGRKGAIYIDADDEGFAYAGVSWAPVEPEDAP